MLVVPAIGPDGWPALIRYAAATPGVHFGLGIHPQLLPGARRRDDDRHLADLDTALGAGGAVGVGECGLDGPSVAAARRWTGSCASCARTSPSPASTGCR